jgi:hypothetical protein
VWVDGATRAHNWHSGWLPGAIEGLDALTSSTQPSAKSAPLAQRTRGPSEALVAASH